MTKTKEEILLLNLNKYKIKYLQIKITFKIIMIVSIMFYTATVK